MQLHGNARTTPYQRREMARRVLEQAEPAKDTALALGVSVRTVYKWLRRYQQGGEAGLQDRCSRPHQCPNQTTVAVGNRSLQLRRRRRLTPWAIAQRMHMPRAPASIARRRPVLPRLPIRPPNEPRAPTRRRPALNPPDAAQPRAPDWPRRPAPRHGKAAFAVVHGKCQLRHAAARGEVSSPLKNSI